jgi:glycosyltransferase involved in cell wall biosynthesis
LLGQRDHETREIESLAADLLSRDGYRITSVCRRDVWDYYRAADAFTLASLMEGFGFVYVEALAAGLPVIAHDFPISRWVLGEHGTFANLTEPGALARELSLLFSKSEGDESRAERRSFVTARYDWRVLRRDYVGMFELAATHRVS